MAAGVKTSPEVEAEAVRLIREGHTRRQVSDATGVSTRVLTRIAKDAGVEWARVGSGSSGTPEGAAKARGFRSEYMRNRREQIADKLLDAAEHSADLAAEETDPRRRQALMQSADASMRAYASVTKGDILASEQDEMRQAISSLDKALEVGTLFLERFPVRPGLIQE